MRNFQQLGQLKWKKTFFVLFLQLSAIVALAQVRISGTVTGPDGKGIAAISVLVHNTNYGSVTDADGKYSIQANLKPGAYTLDFSGVGFKSQSQSLQVGNTTSYNADAQLTIDALNMDEVILTGVSLGTTRKQLGSYISTVKADQLTKGATSNVLSALQGKTAGAQIIQNNGDPAGGFSVRLRGISSILSSSEPLYIVDGVIVNNATNRVTNTQSGYDGNNFVGTIGQNRLADINPADIDHIEVLNGAAAAAIYGSRANAGVVQIFTKKGVNGAPVVNFSTGIMMNQLRKKIGVNKAPLKYGGPTDGPGALTQDLITTVGGVLPTNTTTVTRYDYQDYIFHTGLGTDNNISVSGGTDKTKYYISGSYFYNQGIVKNTDAQRYSFRANIDQTINRWLSVNLGLNYINSSADEKPDGNSFFSPMNSVTIIGNFHNIWKRDALGNIQAVGERGRVNPVSVIEDFKQREQTSRIIADLGAKIKPMKGLTIDYTLGIDNYAQNGTTYMPPFTYNVNTAFFGGGPSLDPTLNGYASTGNNYFFQINNELNGTYQFNISKDIASITQVGYSLQYEKNNYSLLQGRGMAPFVQTVNGASTLLPSTDSRSEISVSGTYLQQNFKYKNQLFITGAIRRDGSSVFGENERNQLYYKASGSYLISETGFWKDNVDWWNTFKIRAAYGQSGNLTGIGAYSRFNTYSSNSYLSRTALNSSSTLANSNVKPERQGELEIGTDMSFLKDRLGITFNWYSKKVTDLLYNRNIAPTNGFSSLLDNLGSLQNKGFEILLTGTPISKKDLQWDVTLIYNHNRNKVLNVGSALILLSTNAGAPVSLLQGYPIGVFYGTFFAVDGNGNQVKNSAGIPQIEKGVQNSPLSYTPQRDNNGLPTGTTLRKVIGDPNPKYTATLTNDVSYKKFGLHVQLDAVQGLNVFNADFRTRQGVGNGLVAQQEDLGQVPRGYILGVYQVEQWRIDDGAFVKLREVSLSYDLGKFKFFKDLSVSLSGRNLISWDKYKGYDPEVNSGGQSTILRGIDFGSVPIPRTFKLGIAAKF
ncbi:MAG: SusC/RagA family TonB-linked outer membrane protein [Bacteroidetes bacterium]|nr:SusC/RagA family TonB-linked outer membrane protein [Bacteroidota bacterium]MBS1931337.1 SusC/RagA family TonB-linked outer membrane protein [Bacteroidota bacterium]